MQKLGVLYNQLPNKRAICNLCARRCNIPEESMGFCGVRKNINGKIYSTTYGSIAAINLDPIEKKPLFHYKPGASMLSVGTNGCNFNCQYCQNWDLSHSRDVANLEVSPELLVDKALRYKADGISYTYNEPTVFMEYALDTAKLAHKHGLFNTFVTNGFMTPEAVDAASGLIDAMTVDFKGNANTKFAMKYISIMSEQPIFSSLLAMKEKGMFIEITDLIVPKFGDSVEDAEKLVKWIYDNLGSNTPIHFLRFHPDFKMNNLPFTPIKTLEHHYKIAKNIGMNYVYLGNVYDSKYENTYCPKCSALLIERLGIKILKYNITKENKCNVCGEHINIKIVPNIL
ncbi:MAG: AmmeMemoRadiSam system radical SAM enzyme [Candidatus Marsarchaeota archaeon]|jgi:pyruvate formate lyase activating enzyme|nr:AmmeMemoRadiSam system radical SAM enzyme [Deltaproteobacteria bacterium]MCL5434060.1 AmmeMemoRadiSam system radical SAM enzyme [Candidatus Marsarchaeota archaeon]